MTLNVQFANNATTYLASSITNVATSLTVQAGGGALFPTLTGSQYFYCTLTDAATTLVREIVKVTARSADTFTIVRAQEGTTGTAFLTSDIVELRLTKQGLVDLHDQTVTPQTTGFTITEGTTPKTLTVDVDLTASNVLQSSAIGSTVQAYDADLTTWAGVTPGTGVATALAVNIGAAGSPVVNGGALGTPSSGTLTNCTGLPAAGVSGTALVAAAIGTTVQAYDADLTTWAGVTPGTGVATALAVAVGSAGAVVTNGGALGTPSSGTLTSCTGLPQAGTVGLTTADSPQFAGINLGHASDTTLTRVSAGVVAVEGVTIATLGANVFTGQQTLKEVKDTVYTITDGAAFEIDPANGSVQIVTLGASRTPAATNFEAGQTVLLMIDDGTAYTVTWTTVAPTWKTDAGSAPTLNTTGYTAILLWKVATTMYGARVGDA